MMFREREIHTYCQVFVSSMMNRGTIRDFCPWVDMEKPGSTSYNIIMGSQRQYSQLQPIPNNNITSTHNKNIQFLKKLNMFPNLIQKILLPPWAAVQAPGNTADSYGTDWQNLPSWQAVCGATWVPTPHELTQNKYSLALLYCTTVVQMEILNIKYTMQLHTAAPLHTRYTASPPIHTHTQLLRRHSPRPRTDPAGCGACTTLSAAAKFTLLITFANPKTNLWNYG